MTEFETVAWLNIDGHYKQVPVNVIFEMEGNKPIGLWVEDEHGKDITEQIDGEEYEFLNMKACRHVAETMNEAAEMAADMER